MTVILYRSSTVVDPEAMGYHVENPEISTVADHLPTDDVESLETMLNAFEESIQHQVPENYTNFWLL